MNIANPSSTGQAKVPDLLESEGLEPAHLDPALITCPEPSSEV